LAVADGNRVAHVHRARFALNFHAPAAFQNEINFFRLGMKMREGALIGQKRRFGKALIVKRRATRVEKFADLRAVGGEERRGVAAVEDGHVRKMRPIRLVR